LSSNNLHNLSEKPQTYKYNAVVEKKMFGALLLTLQEMMTLEGLVGLWPHPSQVWSCSPHKQTSTMYVYLM